MIYIKKIIENEIVQKILALLILIIFLYAVRNMINIFLLTFIITFILYNIQNFIYNSIRKYFNIHKKIIAILVYIVILGFIVLIFYNFMPLVIKQLTYIINQIRSFDIQKYKLSPIVKNTLNTIFKDIKISSYLQTGSIYAVYFAKNIGIIFFNIFMALLLSLFFLLEQDNIKNFFLRFEKSKAGFLFKQYRRFGSNFLNSFGKVIQMQLLIALINSILSIIVLFILGFPQVLGLGALILILGLIPVAGVFISLIPLSIIAYTIGGFIKIIDVIIMITILHAIESYVLNPKLMSMRIKVPTFVTFIILIISENLMGVWGLLIGLPLFIFILDLLEVKV